MQFNFDKPEPFQQGFDIFPSFDDLSRISSISLQDDETKYLELEMNCNLFHNKFVTHTTKNGFSPTIKTFFETQRYLPSEQGHIFYLHYLYEVNKDLQGLKSLCDITPTNNIEYFVVGRSQYLLDIPDSVSNLRIAADAGFPPAQQCLGEILAYGTEKFELYIDDMRAQGYFLSASDTTMSLPGMFNYAALFSLGMLMYRGSRHISKDLVKSQKNFESLCHFCSNWPYASIMNFKVKLKDPMRSFSSLSPEIAGLVSSCINGDVDSMYVLGKQYWGLDLDDFVRLQGIQSIFSGTRAFKLPCQMVKYLRIAALSGHSKAKMEYVFLLGNLKFDLVRDKKKRCKCDVECIDNDPEVDHKVIMEWIDDGVHQNNPKGYLASAMFQIDESHGNTSWKNGESKILTAIRMGSFEALGFYVTKLDRFLPGESFDLLSKRAQNCFIIMLKNLPDSKKSHFPTYLQQFQDLLDDLDLRSLQVRDVPLNDLPLSFWIDIVNIDGMFALQLDDKWRYHDNVVTAALLQNPSLLQQYALWSGFWDHLAVVYMIRRRMYPILAPGRYPSKSCDVGFKFDLLMTEIQVANELYDLEIFKEHNMTKKLVDLYGSIYKLKVDPSDLTCQNLDQHVEKGCHRAMMIKAKSLKEQKNSQCLEIWKGMNSRGSYAELIQWYKDVEPNDDNLFYYTHLLAQKDVKSAQFQLATFYLHGTGCDIDDPLARYWIDRFGFGEVDFMPEIFAYFYTFPQEVLHEEKKTIKLIKEIGSVWGHSERTQYIENWSKHRLGDVKSSIFVGRALLNGYGVIKNEEKGLDILFKASNESYDLELINLIKCRPNDETRKWIETYLKVNAFNFDKILLEMNIAYSTEELERFLIENAEIMGEKLRFCHIFPKLQTCEFLENFLRKYPHLLDTFEDKELIGCVSLLGSLNLRDSKLQKVIERGIDLKSKMKPIVYKSQKKKEKEQRDLEFSIQAAPLMTSLGKLSESICDSDLKLTPTFGFGSEKEESVDFKLDQSDEPIFSFPKPKKRSSESGSNPQRREKYKVTQNDTEKIKLHKEKSEKTKTDSENCKTQ